MGEKTHVDVSQDHEAVALWKVSWMGIAGIAKPGF
jgi:hypothetical protein